MIGIIDIIIYLFLALLVGALIGYFGAIISHKISNRKQQKNALKVMEGTKENKTEIDGKIVTVDRFVLRDENGKEIIIDLKGGVIKNGKENKNSQRDDTRRIQEKNLGVHGKNSKLPRGIFRKLRQR